MTIDQLIAKYPYFFRNHVAGETYNFTEIMYMGEITCAIVCTFTQTLFSGYQQKTVVYADHIQDLQPIATYFGKDSHVRGITAVNILAV